jgi:aminotransferase
MRVSERVSVFPQSVIREMTRIAIRHGAINLAQGFPDFAAPDGIKQAAVNAILADDNQYAITWGSKPLRNAITEKVKRYNKIEADPEVDIAVTCGATEAMMASMIALIDPGDEVIIFEPFYENYGPDAAMSGAKPVFVPLVPPEYTFDPVVLRAAFSPRTRAIVLNTPNNPTGRVFTYEELETIARLCVEFDVVALSDEIYEYILYDGRRHIRIASLPGMTERTVTINSISKTYSVTGWRVGYAIAKPPVIEGIRKAHDFLTVGAPAPLQAAAAEALGWGDEYFEQLARDYTTRRDILLEGLERAGFKCTVPAGAYYIMADFSQLSGEDDTTFAMKLTREVGVAPVPASSFYSKGSALGRSSVRFTFCKTEPTLRAAAERLLRLRA